MSKKRIKMTMDEVIKRTLVGNYHRVFARKWGCAGCNTCQSYVDAVGDALVDKYLRMKPEERDPEGRSAQMANPDAYAQVMAGIWLIDMIMGLPIGTMPACPTCGWRPVNQFQSTTEDQP